MKCTFKKGDKIIAIRDSTGGGHYKKGEIYTFCELGPSFRSNKFLNVMEHPQLTWFVENFKLLKPNWKGKFK